MEEAGFEFSTLNYILYCATIECFYPLSSQALEFNTLENSLNINQQPQKTTKHKPYEKNHFIYAHLARRLCSRAKRRNGLD